MTHARLQAVIDVGSHEIQMKIAELHARQNPRVVESVRHTLAIGIDTYNRGRISQPVLDRSIKILQQLKQTLKTYGIEDCPVLATSAFREADNRVYAAFQIEKHCGFKVQILSNSQERFHHTLATIAMMPDFSQKIEKGTLLVDISAGSIQLTVYHKGRFLFSQNLLLGSLRIRELLSHLAHRTSDIPALMEEYISADLATYHLHEPKGIVYENLILTGHELSYLKKLAGLGEQPLAQMSGQDFGRLYQRLIHTKPLDLAQESGIPSEHASLLLPAAIIIHKLLGYTGVETLDLPGTTLCDGVLVERAQAEKGLVLNHDPVEDILSASRHLAKRFKTDRRHNEAVEKAAMALFDATSRLHDLGRRQRLLLQVAAILRDCGKYVNISRHHNRSFNIILATELIGLSQEEQETIAWVARFHGTEQPLQESRFLRLSSRQQWLIAQMTALLRLADALDAGHQQKILELKPRLGDKMLTLTLVSDQDLTMERWSLDQKATLFEEVFGCRVESKVRRSVI